MKFILLLLTWLFSSVLHSQSAVQFTGNWEGKLNVGIELRIVFHIKEVSKGVFRSEADSPDQSAFGLKCDTTIVTGNDITIEMKELGASFKGKLVNNSTIDGQFTQGASLALILKKTDKVSQPLRPQTPLPPFIYQIEDLSYYNNDRSIQYGATLTIPAGKGPFPAAVLITGSGPQDRDETIMGHKLFAVLADHLTRHGFVVLRVDDRGVGKTTGVFGSATSADFANDVNAGFDYLLTRPEVNRKKIGLIGHSEGGMIAPMVAAHRKDIEFIIMLAGPGVPIVDLMAEQNFAIARSSGVSADALKEIVPLFKSVVNSIRLAKDSTQAIAQTQAILDDWIKKTPQIIQVELNLASPVQRAEYTHTMVSQLKTPWFNYFINFNPDQWLKKLDTKVLALNGDKDIQVISSQNLPGIRLSLEKSKTKDFEIKELPGLNHLFQTCIKCTLEEYGELEESFSPAALNIITEWLDKKVK